MRRGTPRLLIRRDVTRVAIAMLLAGPTVSLESAPRSVRRIGHEVPDAVEKMYERGLGYLVASQSKRGSWSDPPFGVQPGVVGLGVLAALAYGEDPNHGPHRIVIKRGEYGVLMTREDGFFAVPGLPLEDVFDPTGAGDTFAGGFVGYLAAAPAITDEVLTRAIIAGSTMASFAVEDFGLDRLVGLTESRITQRFAEFKRLTHFEAL